MASKMDASNPRILKMVADLYLLNDKPEDAERTYRALLLVVRRQPPGDDPEAVGASEVLFELHMIAKGRGDAEPAKELLESALEAAMQSDAEVRRLRRSLIAHGQDEVLLKALRMRLQSSEETESRAGLLADIARVLDGRLQRAGEALDAQLEAMALIPDRLELHDAARELARKADQVDRYVTAVEATVEHLRRKKDAPIVATLLMKAAAALEDDAGDLRRALSIAPPRPCSPSPGSPARWARTRSGRAPWRRCSSWPTAPSRRRRAPTRSTGSPRCSSPTTSAGCAASSCWSRPSPPIRATARPAPSCAPPPRRSRRAARS
jgi:tetratricopeptide (TPR) repeat protein